MKIVEAPNSTQIDELFDKNCITQKATNRKCLLKILETIRALTLRNIALRGHEEHGFKDSNLYEICKLRGSDDSDFMHWIDKKRGTYLNHESQNDMLILMGMRVLRELLRPIQEGTYSKCFEFESSKSNINSP